MSISFSGVGSGLPISDWIDALVEVEQSKIDTLVKKQENLNKKSSVLNSLNSTYSSVKSASVKFTDALHGSAADIFSKVSVTTTDSSIVTAKVILAQKVMVLSLFGQTIVLTLLVLQKFVKSIVTLIVLQ